MTKKDLNDFNGDYVFSETVNITANFFALFGVQNAKILENRTFPKRLYTTSTYKFQVAVVI